MVIGRVDVAETNKKKKRLNRNVINKSSSQVSSTKSEQPLLDSDDFESKDEESDNDIISPYHKKRLKTSLVETLAAEKKKSASEAGSKQMRKTLPNLAIACDRAGVSDRAAAIIASSVLQDFGLVTNEKASEVIDRSKLRRERKKMRNKLQCDSKTTQPLGIYFDGRKDKTIENTQINGSHYRKTVTEEHIVLLSEPDSIYIGHVTPDSGTSEQITSSIIKFIKENEIELTKLIAIGCDGTNVNTGKNNGIIKRIEEFVGHKLHWFVCLLHANELPLRHLFQKIDGKTIGPKQYAGEIGKALETCESLPIVDFQPISTLLPVIEKTDLSSDQQYLLDICNAISTDRPFPTGR